MCACSRPKLDALEDLIEAANGKPVLVMYNYQHDLARIQQRFGKYSPRIRGGVRELKTARDMEDWNAGKDSVARPARLHRPRPQSPARQQHHRVVRAELVAGTI